MDTQKRLDEHERRLARVEKSLEDTAKLVKLGMRLFMDSRKKVDYEVNALIDAQHRNDERFRETDERFREIAERFRETDERFRKSDEKFNRLIERLGRKNPNGHSS